MLKRVFHIIFTAVTVVTFAVACYYFHVEYIKMSDPSNDILEGLGLFFAAVFAMLIISGEIGIWRSLHILLFEKKSRMDIIFCFLMLVLSVGTIIPTLMLISGQFIMNSTKWYEIISFSCFILLLIISITYAGIRICKNSKQA